MNMIDWVPVDKLSQIISEIVQYEYKRGASSLVYNLVILAWANGMTLLRNYKRRGSRL